MAAALYVIPGCSSNPGAPADLKSLATGQMKSLTVDPQPSPAPTTAFTDAAGKAHTLAEFKGKAVVVNLWATWCAPCVQEMPTLAKLADETQGQPVVIVPISLDRTEDRANAQAFIGKRPPLPFYNDPTFGIAYAAEAAERFADDVADRRLGHGSRPGGGRRGLVGTRCAACGRGARKDPLGLRKPRACGLTVAIEHAHFWSTIRALGLQTIAPAKYPGASFGRSPEPKMPLPKT